MFKKLLSNLPFNPSLIKQLSFYTKRMKREASIRRLSTVFIVMAMLIQVFAVISPAQQSLASSSNDIIPGGIKSRQDAVNWCNSNTEIRTIYAYYGASCGAIASAAVVTRNTHDYSSQMYSLGRLPYGKQGEKTIPINNHTYYSRYVWSWGNYNFRALEGTGTNGKKFLIMYDCGNIVSIGQPTPPPAPKKPDISVTKVVSNTAPLKGQTFTYTITVKNNGPATATGVVLQDTAPIGINFLSVAGGLGSPQTNQKQLSTTAPYSLAAGQATSYQLTAQLVADGPARFDNTACAIANNGDDNGTNNCGTAVILVRPVCPLPGKQNLPLDDANCNTPGLKIEKTASNKDLKVGDTFIYKLQVTNTGDVDLPRAVVRDVAPQYLEFVEVKQPNASTFSPVKNKLDYISTEFSLAHKASLTIELKAKVVAGTKDPINNEACALGYTASGSPVGSCDKETVNVTGCGLPGKENLSPDSQECRPCAESSSQDDSSVCIELGKHASNPTQKIANANGTTAHADDTIVYTLTAKNTGSVAVKAFKIEENVSDVLDYADVVDLHGGVFDKTTKVITWPAGQIEAGATMKQTLTVKVKNPVPQTPVSSSNPGTFDLTMTNVYGNTVSIKLPPNVVKTTEQITTTLPNTGPGTSLAIGFVLTAVMAYFFARSRLLVSELILAKEEYATSGGA